MPERTRAGAVTEKAGDVFCIELVGAGEARAVTGNVEVAAFHGLMPR